MISGTIPPRIAHFNDIGDVNVPAPVDGYFVYWDAAAGKWQCQHVVTAVDHLNDIGDVNVPAPVADGNVLYWDDAAGKWQARAESVFGCADLAACTPNDLHGVFLTPTGNFFVYFNAANTRWESRLLVDGDIPAAIARDAEVVAAIAAHAALANAHHAEDHAARHEPGGTDVMAVDAVAATGSLRTLGGGAQQAMPGNATPTPAAHENTHVDGGTDEINSALDPTAYPMLAGTLAARPAAGVAGRFYWTTDEHILYRDTGAAWVKVAVADYPDLDSIPASFTPSAHEATHVKGGADDIDSALDARAIALANQGDIPYRAAAANTLAALAPGVAGQALLSGGAGANPSFGVPAPAAHKATHENGGGDEISIAGLDGESVELATHKAVEAAGIHGSAVAATASKLVHRDAASRAKIADPAVAADIDNLGARNAAIAAHAALTTGVHGLDGRRNALINGCAIVDQRATDYTLVKDTYGIRADRWYGMATGTLVSAGVLTKTTAANCGKTGHAFKFSGITLTGTGILYLRYRMEAKDAIQFKNQTASFRCKVYQDTGGAINYTIYIRKANAADDFSAITAISDSGAISVPNTTETILPYLAIAMGDCSNGIEIEIKVECGAITTKNFEFTECQLELGSVATPFEFRLYQQELDLCRRYCQRYDSVDNFRTIFGFSMAYTTSNALWGLTLNPRMRAAPTLTASASATFKVRIGDYDVAFTSGPTINQTGAEFLLLTADDSAAGFTIGHAGFINANNTTAAYLLLDAEL